MFKSTLSYASVQQLCGWANYRPDTWFFLPYKEVMKGITYQPFFNSKDSTCNVFKNYWSVSKFLNLAQIVSIYVACVIW